MAAMTDIEPGVARGVGAAAEGFPSLVERNLAAVRTRIARAGGDPDRVRVVAVTKGFGTAAVDAALGAGLVDLGENYAQELVVKAGHLAHAGRPAVRWHFLGPVQRNKVAALAPVVDLWQSVDRVGAGEAIAHREPGAEVLVQVNASGESSKHGCRPGDAAELVAALRGLGLEVAGLMTIGPQGAPEKARPGFAEIARLARQLGLRELSMGMTDDLEVAVQEGATMVRVGRGLFGPRDQRVRPVTVGS